ncbi:AraC family transcriptional regulator [uncultured Lactobacillus sp.]|uniref:helix-turn-helix domain-containing protein n=1 Tax=uncultured Lactobacillus sp. TaxID=153152 RepID=UPI0026359A9B|nr:AraC family transcriptional regulator [uncultured Lactobacillus sp.]
MATFSLNSYIFDLLRNKRDQSNEVRIEPKDNNFSLYSLYVERQHPDSVSYRTDTPTLLMCINGEAKVFTKELTVKLEPGNIIFVNSEVNYAIQIDNSDALLIKFKMRPRYNWQSELVSLRLAHSQEKKLVALFLNQLKQNGYFCFKNTSVMWPSQILKELIQEYVNGSLFMGPMAKSYVSLIIFSSLRMQHFVMPQEQEAQEFKDRLLDEYINAHYNEISLEKAAKYFGFNKNYFSSMIKEKTGKSFVDHVDERRMREAKRLLAQPDVSLYEIITRVGYSSKSFFYKKFNRYYGMTPAAMRKKLFQEAKMNLK